MAQDPLIMINKCRFLEHVLVVMFMFCGFVNMKAEEITKADIIKTLNHIQQLSKEQKAQLVKANLDYQQQAEQLVKQTELAIRWQAEAKANAKQRDVVLIAFGILAGFYLGTMFAGEVLRNFPAPWSFIAAAAIYIGAGIGAYTLGRFLLATLAHFIP